MVASSQAIQTAGPARIVSPGCGVLALELAPDALPTALTLPTEAAAGLGDCIARDLARLLPEVETLGLAIGAALYDQAQVLRPGWPLFATLATLYEAQTRGHDGAAIVAFGAAGGEMADALLLPDTRLVGAPLLVIPFVLLGEEGAVARSGARMEEAFTEQGLASAATALFLAQALSVRVEHARYLTRDDLAALCALQLEHAGLATAWKLLEAALFSPDAVETARTVAGRDLRYAGGRVSIAVLGLAPWARAAGAAALQDGPTEAFAAWHAEQRRLAALFAAHALAVDYAHVASPDPAALARAPRLATAYWIESDAAAPDPQVDYAVFAHTAPALGVVALSAAMRRGGRWVCAARGYPLAPDGLAVLYAALVERYAIVGRWRVIPLALSGDGEDFVLPE